MGKAQTLIRSILVSEAPNAEFYSRWFNPIGYHQAAKTVSENHSEKALISEYGNILARPAKRKFKVSFDVVADVVKRYDVAAFT